MITKTDHCEFFFHTCLQPQLISFVNAGMNTKRSKLHDLTRLSYFYFYIKGNINRHNMAASINFCRVKLFVAGCPSCQSQQMWHTIKFADFKTVKCVLKNLSNLLNIDSLESDLYLQNILVPKWETCSYIFRDNDEIEQVLQPLFIAFIMFFFWCFNHCLLYLWRLLSICMF